MIALPSLDCDFQGVASSRPSAIDAKIQARVPGSSDHSFADGRYVAAQFVLVAAQSAGLIGGNVAETPIANATMVAVLSAGEDRTSLASIFAHSNWKLRFTRALFQTQTALSKSPVGVVISESCLSDGHCWKDLLLELQKLEDPPPLIVADRLADERLWAEVLNLGVYDLLAKPFDGKEVLHVVSTACRRRENEQVMTPRRKPATSAKRGSAPGTNVCATYGH